MGSPKEFWPSFCADFSPPDSGAGVGGSLASEVLTYFGIPHTGTGGGPLANLDIKHMDAEQIIKLSLLEDGISGSVKEMIVNEYGMVAFKEIGGSSGLSGCEVYYQIQSASYREACKGVMVTGGKPLPTRKQADFVDIWDSGFKGIYNAFWIANNGMSETFSQYAVIVFEDPHLSSSYKDGIDNLYNITSPWESIVGYARYIDWPGSKNSPETTVERADTSTIPILVSGGESSDSYTADLGTLERKEPMGSVDGITAGPGTSATSGGIEVPIPDGFRYTTIRGSNIDMLTNVHSVVIVGRKVDTLIGVPKSDAAAMSGEGASPGEVTVMANVNSIRDSMYTLKAGDHYIISYEQDIPYIVFADNSRAHDPATFGTGIELQIDEDSAYFAGEILSNVSVLPTGGTDGFLVKQVIVLVNLKTPCINIYDPRHGKALEIAEGLIYQLSALIYVEEPAPVAYNGNIIDQTAGIVDHDPTTQQSFTDTPYEQALDDMSGGGMATTLAFLDAAGCSSMSSTLYDLLNGGNGTVTTYVCGPNSTPELGGYGGDSASVVNDIIYSYSDSNSYTVSVSTGPKLLGDLASIAGGATMKSTENVPSTGKVIQDLGDHVHYKLLLDGCGNSPMIAINTAPKVIRVGDVVQCTVYNNAIEQ